VIIQSGFRILVLLIAPALLLLGASRDPRQDPRLMVLEPSAAAPGEIVTAYGANLERARVVELILEGSDGTTLVRIVEQGPDLIRFRVPASIAPGQYRIVLLATTVWGREMIDQDVVLIVINPERTATARPLFARRPGA